MHLQGHAYQVTRDGTRRQCEWPQTRGKAVERGYPPIDCPLSGCEFWTIKRVGLIRHLRIVHKST